MKHIKVLKYDYKSNWMSLEDIHGPDAIKYLAPVFNREGWYYDRKLKFSWYEYVNEKGNIIAYTTKDKLWKRFEYELKILNHVFFLDKEVKALKVLWEKLPSDMREQYWFDKDCKNFRFTYRNSRKHCLQSLKSLAIRSASL